MFGSSKQKQSQNPQKFVDPERLLAELPVTPGMAVADFGCGNGYYSLAAGKFAGSKGRVYALDIMEDALSQTSTLARLHGIYNVSTQLCDLEKFRSTKVSDTSVDLVIISSLIHQAKNKDNVVREAYRILKTQGKVLVVEWKANSPFGPESRDRIGETEARALLEKYGFRPLNEINAGAFHYALVYGK
ncbi:class I SAM-dependent methyltransferase [bacterium]|nr:MAG: class I SAM-dependent methyltransferase [bacterium]